MTFPLCSPENSLSVRDLRYIMSSNGIKIAQFGVRARKLWHKKEEEEK